MHHAQLHGLTCTLIYKLGCYNSEFLCIFFVYQGVAIELKEQVWVYRQKEKLKFTGISTLKNKDHFAGTLIIRDPYSVYHTEPGHGPMTPGQIAERTPHNYYVGFKSLHPITLFTWDTINNFLVSLVFRKQHMLFWKKAAYKAASTSEKRRLSVSLASRLRRQLLLQWHNKLFKLDVAERHNHAHELSTQGCQLTLRGNCFGFSF